ncbi:MAG: hypothetical protein J2P48_15100 [Alphaproteobacteria bacterium]|nr:hypothetical protein [Alphaproteobacteria bacterium]
MHEFHRLQQEVDALAAATDSSKSGGASGGALPEPDDFISLQQVDEYFARGD